MKWKNLIVSLAVNLICAGQVCAEGSGRVNLLRDSAYEQNLRYQASADRAITPAKVIRWLQGYTGHATKAPSSTEFQPLVNSDNGHYRVVAVIAYKF